MTQAKVAERLEHKEIGVVVAVRFDKDEFEKVSKFAEAEGIPLDALIRDVVLKKANDKEALAALEKMWAEDAKLRREREIPPPPCIWDVPNDDDMDEWLRE